MTRFHEIKSKNLASDITIWKQHNSNMEIVGLHYSICTRKPYGENTQEIISCVLIEYKPIGGEF